MKIVIANREEYRINCDMVRVINKDIRELESRIYPHTPTPALVKYTREIHNLKQWRRRLERQNLSLMSVI